MTLKEEYGQDQFLEYLDKRVNMRSAWGRGVGKYAVDLCENLFWWVEEYGYPAPVDGKIDAILRNGADSWYQYSHGGAALCYDTQIAKRVCTPSELRKIRNGGCEPNSRESWLDVQARALYQAANLVKAAYRDAYIYFNDKEEE